MRERPSGFTLIELLVVLTVLAILAVTIVPLIAGSLHAAQLSTSARELIACTRIAHSRAVTAGVSVRLLVDEENGRYRVEERRRHEDGDTDGGRTAVSGSIFTPVLDVPGASGKLRSSVRLRVKEYEAIPANSGARAPARSRFSDRRRDRRGSPSTAAGQSILFRPDGTTQRREFLLRDVEGFGLRLRLLPATARVEIERLPREPPASDPLSSEPAAPAGGPP